MFVFTYFMLFGVVDFTTGKIERLDQIDLDSGRRNRSCYWEDERYYASNFKEIIKG